MRHSENTDPLFVGVWPDWSNGVTFTTSQATTITTTRAGLEQRERMRLHGKMRIVFQRRGLSLEEWKTRLVRILAEHQSVCTVPFWSEGIDAVRQHAGTLLRVGPGRVLRVGPSLRLIVVNQRWQITPTAAYRPEMWSHATHAYVSNGESGYFARLLAVRVSPAKRIRGLPFGRVLSRLSPPSFIVAKRATASVILSPPPTDDLRFDSARIFPCLECRRVQDQQDQEQEGAHSRDEMLMFETLH